MPQWKWQVQQLQVQEPRGAARSARSAEPLGVPLASPKIAFDAIGPWLFFLNAGDTPK